MTHISEIPAGTLVKQAHAGVKLIAEQYPEAAAVLREAITRFDVLREVHQLAKQEAQPVIPERPELRYGDNVLWFLNELAAFDASDIDSDDFDVYGEDRNGIEGCATISITELAADAAKLLSAQPVSNPYKLPVRYFSYGSECGFDWHNTEKEAIEAAEAVIDDYRGDACDGWSEETDSVCWGVILQQATKVDERPRTDDDKCDPAIDTVCDYALLPELVGNSPVIPDGWKLVPIEPTENMIIEGFESEPDKTFSKPEVWEEYAEMSGCKQAAYRAKLCWAAMLAAAPTPQKGE